MVPMFIRGQVNLIPTNYAEIANPLVIILITSHLMNLLVNIF
ncbi:hypothetical protein [Thermococcus sp.]|nr:hypothetical protein [Thermococcus sp.]